MSFVKTLTLHAFSVVLLLGIDTAVLAERPEPSSTAASNTVETRIIENGTIVRRTSKFEVRISPIRDAGRDARSQGGAAPNVGAGACPTEEVTHSSFDFEDGGALLLQAGFVETEIAAAEHVVPADSFPVRVDVMEKIFGTQNTSVSTTTEWSVLIWAGPPDTGTLIDVFSSDDVILPHLVIPPGTNAVNVQVIVDPDDPEPIIVPANASNSVTIGFRIDSHNDPPTEGCSCPLFGDLPAVCCPPPTTSNAFPSNDADGVASPSLNWLWARGCPGTDPLFCGIAPEGWYDFNTSGLPSGDWNIRLTYTGLNCPEDFGACCFPGGDCQILSEADCDDQDGVFQGVGVTCNDVFCPPSGACCLFVDEGTVCEVMDEVDCIVMNGLYQGDGVTCAEADCPSLLGACCINDGQECQLLLSEDCDAAAGAWLGPGTDCGDGACDGACCIEATGACVDFDFGSCDAVDGIWQGFGTSCETVTCFPAGACCLPDGSCADDATPEDCDAAGGVFQGDGTTCAEVSCPEPMGACCLSNDGCLELTEQTCVNVAGNWQGFNSDCADADGNGTADACEQADPCPGDMNNDDVIDGGDLLQLLSQWGPCSDPDECTADFNDDDVVDGSDLLELLSQWGQCPS